MPSLRAVGGTYDGLMVHVHLWQDDVQLLKRLTEVQLETIRHERPAEWEWYVREHGTWQGRPVEFLRWSALEPDEAWERYLDMFVF